MKKTRLSHRVLAMVLVVLLTVQLLPLNALGLAFGTLQSTNTGVNLSTLKQEDAINWPIKIYDYLDDGMLFEWNDSTHTGSLPDGSISTTASVVPYGGGAHPVVTKIGTDFTGPTALFKTAYQSNIDTKRMMKSTYVEAEDFKTPRFLRLESGGPGTSGNFTVTNFSTDLGRTCTIDDMRYMTIVYRAKGLTSKQDLTVCPITTGGTWTRTSAIPQTMIPNTTSWKAVTIDLKNYYSRTGLTYGAVAIDFGYNGTRGLPSGAQVDISHIGFFNNNTEAKNYGEAALEFIANPGEYLRKSTGNFTATTTTVTPTASLSYIFSLNYRWKTANAYPAMFGTDEVSKAEGTNTWYGMDFTTTSKSKGDFANAYTSDTYWTWANGSPQTYKYTDGGITTEYTFNMDPIGVQERAESNGAMYVRLTADKNSKILLSKFREDHTKVYETYVPLTKDIEYMVLVYRNNGLTTDQQFGLWAQGYEEATCDTAGHTWASNWKIAGMSAEGTDWTRVGNINKWNIKTDSGWQYQIIPLTETIGAKDEDMQWITRTARLGLYLPAMDEGQSLDLAYVSYFKKSQRDKAEAFGAAAVEYMNSKPQITTTTATKNWANNRVWNTGNNKGFGMLYSTGGGNWPVSSTNTSNATGTHSTAGGANSKDAYGYNTWMIGYNTQCYSDIDYNANRRDPITGEKYTAKYTSASTDSDKSLVIKQNVTGTTNHIFFISAAYSNDGNGISGFDTEVLDFDGYQLLERVTSGIMTAGLLEGSLRTVRSNGTDYRIPVYRQETVEYLAYLLVNSLRIPKRDANGSYNSNFISGSPSTKFGGVDLNGDGKIGMINLDGDSRTGTNGNECNEASVDLATALRHCLGITLPVGANVGTLRNSYAATLGNYQETLKKDDRLVGDFQYCRTSITTAMDAAYYMLNSLFVGNSYNQKQDDYYYLNMPMAEVTTNNHSGNAYVFDAGFTVGKTANPSTNNGQFTDDGTNKSAVQYSPVVDANGNAGTGTISLATNTTGKTRFNFSISGGTNWTTRFPFVPVTGATGDFAGQTNSYYFWDDDVRTYYPDANSYINRNYNYVLASNGEFVFNEKDALFFEFEGDDDVYLFINGELVLDIGAAHSITSVYIDVNDYVTKAREVMAELHQYGYTSDMPIAKFDDMIESDTLERYVTNADGIITGTEPVPNPYTEAQKQNFKRWVRLDLVDGQICNFDFYYMERHGWGANMRIVTNMHITDPALSVDKTAYQYGQEIEYGGVIDPTSSLEYNFALTNSGNQKLYNLTFEDNVIGVKLDPTNGLTVDAQKNGVYILDNLGKSLEAKDLTAVVSGYNGIGQYTEVVVTFPEVNGDGGQTAMKNFLKRLTADGTESGNDDAEITHAGSGLWVDATVTIKGIYYMLTPEQTKAGTVHNTVYLTATTRVDPKTVGNLTLKSDDDHVIYTSGFPVHYQWAEHNIFIKMDHLLEEAKHEAQTAGSQLNLYNQFFNSVDDLGDIYYNLCDKYGRTGGVYPFHSKYTVAGHEGYLVNYKEPGIYTFYLLLYKRTHNNKQYKPTGENAENIAEGAYAIIRSQVYVADVEDSAYVLDYGLTTQSLDANGELFKNDYLFGPYGTIRAKLMGITNEKPEYLDPYGAQSDDFCRIAFQMKNGNGFFSTANGIFKANLAIPENGKLIGYDSSTGQYTLTGVGTMTITAKVPTTDSWKTPYLYYWYDGGVTGPAWPGTPMKKHDTGVYELDIPADVTNVIINNGSGALQTEDLKITPGLDSTINVTVNGNQVSASIETVVDEVKVHVKAPADWEKVYLHHWHDNGDGTTYPGEEMILGDDGVYTLTIHGDTTHLKINNGSEKATADLTIYAGKESWITLSDTPNFEGTYDATVEYSQSKGYTVHASVPQGWKNNVYLYYWHEGMTDDQVAWPGIPMTKSEGGWYTSSQLIPADITHLIVNDGADGNNHQTVNLTVTAGLETWINVNDETIASGDNAGKYTAKVAYGSENGSTGLTFTPKDFMDDENSIWLALTVHSVSFNPSAIKGATGGSVDIHNETQMFKKITIIPATVVYYEDDFAGINYNDKDSTSENVFVFHGKGSGALTQSIDPNQNYGQDSTYQDVVNNLYSGNSLTKVQIKDTSDIAVFDFQGTGFELISRTNAIDSASTVARVYKTSDYEAYQNYLKALKAYEEDTTGTVNKPQEMAHPTAVKLVPVITQFDHGNNGGQEGINQVPTIRVNDLDFGNYTVELSGIPTYTFNSKYEITGMEDTYVYIDGLRIFQPLGPVHDLYLPSENGATVEEIRDLIVSGKIGVGALRDDRLELSTGTITWTENLMDSDFKPGRPDSFEGIKVDSTDDYLIQGPNNEVYMEGSLSKNALVFYVSKDSSKTVHNLQVAIRALDYDRFYGTGSSPLDVQLQYGVLTNGGYKWKNLANVVSGTEQYYTIPFEECPVDGFGRYQIVLRVTGNTTNTGALAAYTSVKYNGLTIDKVQGVGEETLLYFQGGMLVRPSYYLLGTIDGVTFDTTTGDNENPYQFDTDNKLYLNLKEGAYITIKRNVLNSIDYYGGQNELSINASATLVQDGTYTFYVPAGELTLKLKQTVDGSLELSYCQHTWDEGVITKDPNCTTTGIRTLKCTNCGDRHDISIPKNNQHTYVNRVCVRCRAAEPNFYLIGNINGADYGCQDDYLNLGEYLFVDGKLVVTFQKDSYVFIKNENNTDWYLFDGYCTAQSGTLYNTAQHQIDANKMFVPASVELTFTLNVNDDGTLTLSYTMPCNHEWDDGVEMVKPGCTTEGEKLVTCGLCGETKTETVAATGHNYQNGVCTGCGDAGKRIIYFKNSAQWRNLYAWAWDAASNNYTGNTWPGQEMQSAAGMPNLYSIELSVAATNILFSNNGSETERTGDLEIPADGRNLYDFATGQWSVFGGVVDYYLIGYINGANYGCEEDYQNLGEYKFVDGKLVATFTENSYVFLKTTGNANWYMTQAYIEADTATYYNTSTGAGEKMYVPGGVEVTFELVDNGDDSFTLTYHVYDEGTVTMDATCTEEGTRIYVCELCQNTLTETIPATGHHFVGGTCTNTGCGIDDKRVIYFRNVDNWEQVYIWAWVEGGDNYTGGTWPGEPMTPVEGEIGLYSYELSVKAMKVIFSNNGTPKTDGETIPTDGKDMYSYNSGWSTYVKCEHSYTTERVEPGCTANGTITHTCTLCGDVYVQTLAPTGHSFANGSCVDCGEKEAQLIYVKPNDNWASANARFAAYFFDGGDPTWVSMDSVGNGIYSCTIPNGYKKVIFCRMNPGTADNNWNDGVKWNQTGDLPIPTDGRNLCTIDDGQWDCDTNVTWSTYAATYSLLAVRSVKAVKAAAVYGTVNETAASDAELPAIYLTGSLEGVANLPSIRDQLSSNEVVGQMIELKPIPDEQAKGEVKITTAAPILSDDLRMRYWVTVPAGSSNIYMVFRFNGEETVVRNFDVEEDGRYSFVFSGINPQKMGDVISATLYATVNGQQVSTTRDNFSILRYCTYQLEHSDDQRLLTMVSDLLVYGAKTQIYQGYKTDALVTDGLELTPSTFVGAENITNKISITGKADPAVKFTGIGLRLSGKMTVVMNIATVDPDAYTFKVTVNNITKVYTGEDLVQTGEGSYSLRFDDLKATAFDDVVTAVIEKDGVQVGHTVTFSVNSYVKAYINTEDVALHELLEAIYNYGRSAENFV